MKSFYVSTISDNDIKMCIGTFHVVAAKEELICEGLFCMRHQSRRNEENVSAAIITISKCRKLNFKICVVVSVFVSPLTY